LSPVFTSSSYSLTGLTPYSAYEWQVAGYCTSTQGSVFSSSQLFNTDCAAPTNLNVSSGTNSVNLYWNTNESSSSYTIQYRLQGVTDWSSVTTIGSSYYLNNIQGSYEWRIRAECGNGFSSGFSSVNTFATYCNSPNAPAVSDLSSYAALVSWNTNSEGCRFNLQWRPSGTTSWNTISNIVQQNYVLTGLADNSNYDIQVQAQCANQTSYFSSTIYFRATCSSPTGLSSTAYYYFNEPGRKFIWNATPGMDYTLRWRQTAPDGQPGNEWQVRTNALSGLFQPQFLTGTYEWQVQGICANGSQTAFVGGQPFEIRACEPNLITSYASSVRGSSALLTYTNGAITELRWRAVGNPDWTILSPVQYPSVRLSNLTENVAYEWQARVLCANNQPTAFGPLQTFTTVCPAPSNPQTTCVLPTGATLAWVGNTDNTYEINWRAIGTQTWLSATVSGNSYQLTNLANGTNYEWRVRPACSAVSSTVFTTPVLFTTQCGQPQSITAVLGGLCKPVTLSWQVGCPATVNYTVRIRNGSSAPWVYYNTAFTALQLNDLVAGTYYEYSVLATCNGTQSNYSDTYYFTAPVCPPWVQCGPATNLTQVIESSGAILRWQSTATSNNFMVRYRVVGGNWTTATVLQTSYVLSGLPNNTLYEWQVRNLCDGSEAYSSPSFFRTRCFNLPTEISNLTSGDDVVRFYFFGAGSLGVEVRYRTEGGTWTTVASTASPVQITGLQPGTRHELQLRTRCSSEVYSDWSPSRYSTTTGIAPVCNGMVTVQHGDWTNPAIWSCGRVPTGTDAVQVLHQVMIPDRGTGRALRVRYGEGGLLRFGTGARLLLAQ
jgi:trimeric autotransporter adhesin